MEKGYLAKPKKMKIMICKCTYVFINMILGLVFVYRKSVKTGIWFV
jgi:hypothetical protein